ncbi:MAG: hypothetical protein ACXWM7_04220 [Parachlamydiaceae bacterium]
MSAPIDSNSNTNTPIQPQDNSFQTVTPEAFMQLMLLFQGQMTGKEGLTIEATGGTTSIQSMKLDDGEVGIGVPVRDSLNIHHPNIPQVNEEVVALAMDLLTNDQESMEAIKSLTTELLNHLSLDKTEGPYTNLVQAAKGGDLPPAQACAFLGGLVMVALTEILADYAKTQSAIDKLMSNNWIITENLLKEVAKDMHDLTLDKMNAQIMSYMAQAMMSVAAVCVQAAGSLGALKELDKFKINPDTGKKEFVGSTTKAEIYQSSGQLGGTIFTGIGNNLVNAWEKSVTGQVEAEMIIKQNVEQQFQKMADKYTQASNDAHAKVAEAYELLKNLTSALLQAFKSLTGR